MIGHGIIFIMLVLAFSWGLPTGLGVWFDRIVAVVTALIVYPVVTIFVAIGLFFLRRVQLQFYIGSLLANGATTFTILYGANCGLLVSFMCSLFAILSSALLGVVLTAIAQPAQPFVRKLTVIVSSILLCSIIGWPIHQLYVPTPDFTFLQAQNKSSLQVGLNPISLANPSLPGPYAVRTFTYGSGYDRTRHEFATGISLKSTTVNASKWVKRWPEVRQLFWGFDQKQFPLNGRVWLPIGEGKFPLVVIVHGNHLMENFSDDGYAYLAQRLASRGFVTVSLDENFLNYSAWSGIPEHDYELRAWLILKHLQQLQRFNEQEGKLLFQQIDFEHIALIGHSRGGQAVAMAADWQRWFEDEDGLNGLAQMKIQAIAALAPTDRSLDYNYSSLVGLSYLTIQGGYDSDVNQFFGARQYNRTDVAVDEDHAMNHPFKAAIYVSEANHSRFNTSWGDEDQARPLGLLLRRSEMLTAASQRKLAQVYVSAFLEATLHGQKGYIPLFQHELNGAKWVPTATIFSRFEQHSFVPLATYEEDRRVETAMFRSTIQTKHLRCAEEPARDRHGISQQSYGAVLQWGMRHDGVYSISLSSLFRKQVHQLDDHAVLSFALTELKQQLAPSIVVELTDVHGHTFSRPLEDFAPMRAQVPSKITAAQWMDKRIQHGKYKEAVQAAFQTYRLPLAKFVQEQPKLLRPSEIRTIRFIFEADGHAHKVMFDDIGFDKSF